MRSTGRTRGSRRGARCGWRRCCAGRAPGAEGTRGLAGGRGRPGPTGRRTAATGLRRSAARARGCPDSCGWCGDSSGITPAFGYGPPHPGAGGTSTLLTSALPGAHSCLIRLLHSVRHRVRNTSFPPRPRSDCRGRMKTSQVPAKDVRTCMGSSTPWSPPSPHHRGDVGVAFDQQARSRRSRHATFRCSIALPVRAPVNASPAASRRPAHDSG